MNLRELQVKDFLFYQLKSEWIAKWLDLQYRIKMHNDTFAVLQLWLTISTFFEDEFISSRLSNDLPPAMERLSS